MRRRVFLLAAVPIVAGACADEHAVSAARRAGEGASAQSPVGTRTSSSPAPSLPSTRSSSTPDISETQQSVDPADYGTNAHEWGERVTGVLNRLDTDERVIALTFDACGGPNGSGYDDALLEFLRDNRVPATLFVNRRWVAANRSTLRELADDPLFDIANHGTEHVPLSVTGAEVYGIGGTADPAGVVAEVGDNQDTLTELIGQPPAYFRAGTAYYDEIAVEIVNDMGLDVVGFDILGDAGATYSAEQVATALADSGPGSIPLLHMNHPDSGTAEGVMSAVPDLRDRGFEFVRLSDYPLVP